MSDTNINDSDKERQQYQMLASASLSEKEYICACAVLNLPRACIMAGCSTTHEFVEVTTAGFSHLK